MVPSERFKQTIEHSGRSKARSKVVEGTDEDVVSLELFEEIHSVHSILLGKTGCTDPLLINWYEIQSNTYSRSGRMTTPPSSPGPKLTPVSATHATQSEIAASPSAVLKYVIKMASS